jgi:xanthine dehydrogenase accessory factor
MNKAILALAQTLEAKQPAALATVIEVKGASPAKVGTKLLLHADGTTAGTVGGGKLEEVVLAECRKAIADGQSRIAHYALTEQGADAVGMLCGGDVRVFIEPYNPPPKLVIVGGGHIGRPLKTIGETVGFEVIVVDVEPGRATVPGLDTVTLNEDSYVVLITTDHVSDEAALRQVIASPARYIGMIGSRSKCKTILEHLRVDGLEAQLERVYAPIGLNLGGPTPQEIALAIMAEIVVVRRGGSGEILSRNK